MAWENGTSRMTKRRANRASPIVKLVEARLMLSCRYFYVIFFGPKGNFVMNKYLYYWTWILVIILLLYVWFEHPGHTYGGFVPSFSEQGMTGTMCVEMGRLVSVYSALYCILHWSASLPPWLWHYGTMKTNGCPCALLHPLTQSVITFLSSSLRFKKEREKKVKTKGKKLGIEFP
jgi:hypothetical protein